MLVFCFACFFCFAGYFEGIILIHKAFLTGGLVLVAPGSSAQILIGLIIALVFYTILLRQQPYDDIGEDQMQTIATASNVATLLIGFTLKLTSGSSVALENEEGIRGDYDAAMLDVILVLLLMTVLISSLVMTAMTLPCFASKEDDDVKSSGTKSKSNNVSKVVGTNSSLAITVMMLVGSLVVGVAEGQSTGADAYAKMPDGCKGKPSPSYRSCDPRKAVDELNADGSGTHATYGPMKDWDMSLVTDISYLFYLKKTMNADLSSWDVSRVTTMWGST